MNTDVFVAAIAAAALTLSVVGLILQWITWQRSGPRVSVELRLSVAAWTDTNVQHLVSVTARNAGRSPTQVTNWSLDPVNRPAGGSIVGSLIWQSTGTSIVFPRALPVSAPLPMTLEPSSEATWMADLDAALASLRDQGATHVRPTVSLGSGAKVMGKRFHLEGARR